MIPQTGLVAYARVAETRCKMLDRNFILLNDSGSERWTSRCWQNTKCSPIPPTRCIGASLSAACLQRRNAAATGATMLEAYAYFARSGITVARLPAEHGGSGLFMLNHGLVCSKSRRRCRLDRARTRTSSAVCSPLNN